MQYTRTTWEETKKIGLMFMTIFFIVWMIVGVRHILINNFEITEIKVNTNLEYTTYDEVVKALQVSQGQTLFGYDIKEGYERVKTLPFASSLRIERKLPHTLSVQLKERKIIALFEEDGNLYPIDSSGEIVRARFEENESGYILVKGIGGAKALVYLLVNFKGINNILERVSEMRYVGERRFDLLFDNEVKVMLPENGVRAAIKKLEKLINEQHVFDSKITIIDLRDSKKVFIEYK